MSKSQSSIPTLPAESSMLASTTKGYSGFIRMAMESTDYAMKLSTIQPVVYFAESLTAKGNVKLNIMVDLGFVTLNGIVIVNWSGELQLADGSIIPNCVIFYKGHNISAQISQIKLLVQNQNAEPDSIEDSFSTAGMLQVYKLALDVWKAYNSGSFAKIDHDKAGVKRLSASELDDKIQNAILARNRRTSFANPAEVKATVEDAISIK